MEIALFDSASLSDDAVPVVQAMQQREGGVSKCESLTRCDRLGREASVHGPDGCHLPSDSEDH